MSFEQALREKIAAAPFKSDERTIYKTLLGELQQRIAKNGKVTDEEMHKFVEDSIKVNTQNIAMLPEEDKRREYFRRESEVLQAFLPTYLTAVEIMNELTPIVDEIRAAKSGGQATGVAMKWLKELGKAVKGDVVKEVVEGMREPH